MPATHAPENGTSRLVPETCTCASQSGTSFFSGTSFLHGIEHSFFPSQKLCSTWHELYNVIGRRVVLVQETVTNLRQIFHVLPMPVTHVQKLLPWTGIRNLHEKFDTSWSQFLAPKQLRPITLHASCNVSRSFCDGIELCSIPFQKNCYQIERHTCKFLVPDDCYQFLVHVHLFSQHKSGANYKKSLQINHKILFVIHPLE